MLEGGGDPRARRTPLEGGGDPRARRTPLEGGASPRARRTSFEGFEPSSEADLARGGALLGRFGGPRGPPRRGSRCVYVLC
jgi:hypothetical protein